MGALIQQSFVLAGSQQLVRGALVWRRPVFEILVSLVQPAEAMVMVLERIQVSQLRDDLSPDAVMLPPLFSSPGVFGTRTIDTRLSCDVSGIGSLLRVGELAWAVRWWGELGRAGDPARSVRSTSRIPPHHAATPVACLTGRDCRCQLPTPSSSCHHRVTTFHFLPTHNKLIFPSSANI